MNAFTAYRQGWQLLFQHWKLWGWLYVFNVVAAMVVGLPVFQFLDAKMSSSLAYNRLLDGFDYTVLGDFWHEYEPVVSVFFNQSFLVIGLFVLLYVFWTGGILSIFKKDADGFSFGQFWGDSGRYFGRMFVVSAFFIALQGIVLAAFFYFFMSITYWGSNDYLISEMEFLNPLKWVIPAYLLVATLVAILQDYVKIHLVQTDTLKVTQALKGGLQFLKNNFSRTFLLYLLNILTFLVFALVYSLLQKWVLPSSFVSILLFLLVGQLFVIARVGGKLLNWGSASIFYKNHL